MGGATCQCQSHTIVPILTVETFLKSLFKKRQVISRLNFKVHVQDLELKA